MVTLGLRLVDGLRYRSASMALNPALKGKEYQEVSFPVVREQVLQFADAIGEGGPLFRDSDAARAAGYPEQLAPPTFVTKMQIMTSGQVVVDQELGLDYSRVVHGEQEYEWRRPVFVGDVLTATPRIANIFAKKSNEYLVIEAEIKDADGETVAIGRTTLISRGTGQA
jgi:acyl dehydratase